MKKSSFVMAALFLLLSAVSAVAAEQVKLKYVGTIYADAQGGKLAYPAGVDAAGSHLFIADSGNRRILRFTLKDGAAQPDAVFPMDKSHPVMVRLDAEGNLLVLDEKDRRIVVLGPDGRPRGNFEPKGIPEGGSEVVPKSFAVAENGTVLILDIFSARVLILDAKGTYLSEIPFPEKHGFFSDVAVDRQGNILLLDSVKAIVYLAAKGAESFEPMTESLKDYMNFPTSLAPDNRGRVFLVDQYGSGLAIVGMDGAFLGRKLSMGWSEGMLYFPSRISFGPDGSLFIADRSNHRVQQFSVN